MSKTRLAPVAAAAAVGALVALLLAGTAASAPSLEEQRAEKEAALSEVRERKGVLTTTITAYRVRIERLTEEVAALRTREAEVRARLEAKQAELDRAIADLRRAKDRLEEVRDHLTRALVTLRDRLVAIYQSGTPDLVGVILGASDFDELVGRSEYLSRINGLDEAIVARVKELRDQVRETVRRLREAKETIEAARDAIAAEERALVSARAAVEARQGKLVAARGEREAVLARIGQHEHHIEGDLAEIQAEIEAQLQSTSSAPLPAGPIREGSGQLIWPVDGPVVSGYGPRWGSMHEGIDIAVPGGTPIRAADSGTVVLVQSSSSSGGYGNFICVDHGGGLQTCYAHLSSMAVSSGQGVSQGDVIGYVGCTGHCYGDHLHFEVRISGTPTDPLGYL